MIKRLFFPPSHHFFFFFFRLAFGLYFKICVYTLLGYSLSAFFFFSSVYQVLRAYWLQGRKQRLCVKKCFFSLFFFFFYWFDSYDVFTLCFVYEIKLPDVLFFFVCLFACFYLYAC